IGGVVLLGIVAVVAMGQAKRPEVHDVLAAKQFILKDRDGNDRAMLYMEHTKAMFGLFDGEEKAVLTLKATKEGAASVWLGHRNERHGRILLAWDEEMSFIDAKAGKLGVGLSASPDYVSAFLTHDDSVRVGMSLSDDRRAALSVREQKGDGYAFRVPK
ncbi:MAG: hypothetical protein ACYTDY_19545, partial [Planctomycetota bacterium]